MPEKPRLKTPEDLEREMAQDRPSWAKRMVLGAMGDPGLSPMPMGVVVGSKGGQALVDALAAKAQEFQSGPLGGTQIGEAFRRRLLVADYLRAKYPKIMSKIPGGLRLDYNPGSPVAGEFDPVSGTITYNLAHPYNRDPARLAETIGHEMVHGGVQQVRNPSVLQNYVWPEDPGGYTAYYNQPAEVGARRGGATTEETFRQFMYRYPEFRRLFGYTP